MARHAGAVLLGLLAGAAGSFLQAASIGPLPYGIVLALALTLAAFRVAGRAAGRTSGAAAAAVGWVVAVFLLLLPRPEGDLVLPARVLSYVWMLGGLLLVAASIALSALNLGTLGTLRALRGRFPPFGGGATGPGPGLGRGGPEDSARRPETPRSPAAR